METPISMCREARNTGFVVYMSFTMEPILLLSSFTVNWKSNPLTNSWTDGGRGRGGKRAFSHETTILPWYRLAISYRCCDESFAFRRGEEIPEFLRDKGKQRPRMVSLIRFLVPFRKFVHEGRGTKRKGKCWKNVERGFINDTRQGNFYFLNWIRDRFEIEGNFRMRRVKLQGKRIERQREGTI